MVLGDLLGRAAETSTAPPSARRELGIPRKLEGDPDFVSFTNEGIQFCKPSIAGVLQVNKVSMYASFTLKDQDGKNVSLPNLNEKPVVIYFCTGSSKQDGEEIPIQVPSGMSMLEAAHENEIELEGACEGSLACSTCNVVVMSSLGCQIIARPELDGVRLAIPFATRNFAVDGYVAKPH